MSSAPAGNLQECQGAPGRKCLKECFEECFRPHGLESPKSAPTCFFACSGALRVQIANLKPAQETFRICGICELTHILSLVRDGCANEPCVWATSSLLIEDFILLRIYSCLLYLGLPSTTACPTSTAGIPTKTCVTCTFNVHISMASLCLLHSPGWSLCLVLPETRSSTCRL